MSEPNKFKLDEEPFDMTKWTEKIVREVHETEDAFIFTSVKPFLDSISTFEIQKEELVRAVLLIRMQREAMEKYGAILPNDYLTAVNMQAELEQAFRKGFEEGIRCEKSTVAKHFQMFSRNIGIDKEDKENECNDNF